MRVSSDGHFLRIEKLPHEFAGGCREGPLDLSVEYAGAASDAPGVSRRDQLAGAVRIRAGNVWTNLDGHRDLGSPVGRVGLQNSFRVNPNCEFLLFGFARVRE